MTAIAVTIAGSDSGGGAGIQADLKTFSALGVYGASVITALTAQNTIGVQGIHDVPPSFILQQMDSVFSDLKIKAVKIGMLSQSVVIETVVKGLSQFNIEKFVLDPVMVAASGDKLLSDDAVETLRTLLMPKALLITPNLAESAVLLNSSEAKTEEEMVAQGKALLEKGARAVLMKGGHFNAPVAIDFLVTPTKVESFVSPRIDTKNLHGTGCTLSSAITAGLAKGMTLHGAIEKAKAYVTGAIAASNELSIGHGKGPTHHFHGIW